MNTRQQLAAGLVCVLVAALFALPLVGSNRSSAIVQASAADEAKPLTSPETPQDQQWDMIYGDKAPVR